MLHLVQIEGLGQPAQFIPRGSTSPTINYQSIDFINHTLAQLDYFPQRCKDDDESQWEMAKHDPPPTQTT